MMTLIKIGETSTTISVNGTEQATFNQNLDSEYDIEVTAEVSTKPSFDLVNTSFWGQRDNTKSWGLESLNLGDGTVDVYYKFRRRDAIDRQTLKINGTEVAFANDQDFGDYSTGVIASGTETNLSTPINVEFKYRATDIYNDNKMWLTVTIFVNGVQLDPEIKVNGVEKIS